MRLTSSQYEVIPNQKEDKEQREGTLWPAAPLDGQHWSQNTEGKGKGKGKGKGHPITDHEGPEVEQRYSSTLL